MMLCKMRDFASSNILRAPLPLFRLLRSLLLLFYPFSSFFPRCRNSRRGSYRRLSPPPPPPPLFPNERLLAASSSLPPPSPPLSDRRKRGRLGLIHKQRRRRREHRLRIYGRHNLDRREREEEDSIGRGGTRGKGNLSRIPSHGFPIIRKWRN